MLFEYHIKLTTKFDDQIDSQEKLKKIILIKNDDTGRTQQLVNL